MHLLLSIVLLTGLALYPHSHSPFVIEDSTVQSESDKAHKLSEASLVVAKQKFVAYQQAIAQEVNTHLLSVLVPLVATYAGCSIKHMLDLGWKPLWKPTWAPKGPPPHGWLDCSGAGVDSLEGLPIVDPAICKAIILSGNNLSKIAGDNLAILAKQLAANTQHYTVVLDNNELSTIAGAIESLPKVYTWCVRNNHISEQEQHEIALKYPGVKQVKFR